MKNALHGGAEPIIIAHRGGPGFPLSLPENSRSAFSAAYSKGFRHIETDCRATADGVAVIFHDDTLDRTTDGTGPISGYTWDELAKVRDSAGEPLLRLDEAFAAYPDAAFNIDIKCDDALDPVMEAVRAAGASQRVCLASFSELRLYQVRRRMPDVVTNLGASAVASLLAASKLPGPARRLAARGARALGEGLTVAQVPVQRGRLKVLTPAFIEAAHEADMPVHVWTVNDPRMAANYIEMGADGIITDAPAALADYFTKDGISFAL